MLKSRIVGTGCLALAAMYVMSLVFWGPRVEGLTSSAVSTSGPWLLRLLALKLLLETLLFVPTAVVGLRCLGRRGGYTSVAWIVAVGLMAGLAAVVSYLATALPLYLVGGAWLQFGPQNDFGIGLTLATTVLQLMLVAVVLGHRASWDSRPLAFSHSSG